MPARLVGRPTVDSLVETLNGCQNPIHTYSTELTWNHRHIACFALHRRDPTFSSLHVRCGTNRSAPNFSSDTSTNTALPRHCSARATPPKMLECRTCYRDGFGLRSVMESLGSVALEAVGCPLQHFPPPQPHFTAQLHLPGRCTRPCAPPPCDAAVGV